MNAASMFARRLSSNGGMLAGSALLASGALLSQSGSTPSSASGSLPSAGRFTVTPDFLKSRGIVFCEDKSAGLGANFDMNAILAQLQKPDWLSTGYEEGI